MALESCHPVLLVLDPPCSHYAVLLERCTSLRNIISLGALAWRAQKRRCNMIACCHLNRQKLVTASV